LGSGPATRAVGWVEFERYCRGAFPQLAAQLHAVTGEQEWSHRVAHSVFAEAWTHWGKIRSLPDRTRWVRRRAARQLRWYQRRRWLAGLTPWGRREATSTIPLMKALAHLPSVQRRAIVLHYLAKLPAEQLAEEEKTSTKVILQRLDHGRLALVHRASADWATGDADISSGQWALSPVDEWVARQLTYLEYRLAPRPDTRAVLIAARTARRRRRATIAAVAGVTLLTGFGTAVAATLSPSDRAGAAPMPPPLRSAPPTIDESGLPLLPGLGDPEGPAPARAADKPPPLIEPLPAVQSGPPEQHQPGAGPREGTPPAQRTAPDRRVEQRNPTAQRQNPPARSLFAPEKPPANPPRAAQQPARSAAEPPGQPGRAAVTPAGPPPEAGHGQPPKPAGQPADSGSDDSDSEGDG
jgi:RNA polymerase sigma-70 factor (ECF subfamily)